MVRSLLLVALGIVAGFVAAALTASLASPRRDQDLERRFAALDATLSELQAEVERRDHGAPPPGPAPAEHRNSPEEAAEASSTGEPTSEELLDLRRQADEEYAELERRFFDEPVHPGWANEAARAVTASVTGLEERVDGVLLDTECRSTRCRATVLFPSYHDARAAVMPLVGLDLPPELGCRTKLRYLPPADPEVPYEAVLNVICD